MRGKNELNWTAVAYIAGIVILGNACSRAIRDKQKYINCLSHFGCGFSICINSVFSLLVLFPSVLSIYPENRLVSEFFESAELAKKVKKYRYDNKLEKSYIIAPSYQVASQLAFHGISLDHIKVIHSPKSRFSQYDIWNTSPIQQDAEILYISSDKELPDYVSNHFHISDAIITLPIFHYDLQIATEYLIPLRKNKEQDFTAKNSKIAIVLPTYNEYDNLLSMIEKLHTYVPNGRIIIVDDASPDGTGDLADQEASKNSLITVIHRRAKLGLGSAYVEGFQKAINMGYDIIVQMDADFSHDPAEVPSLINKLTDADVVVGSRYIENGSISNWNLARKFTSIGGSLYARSILGFSYSDFTSGFKSWRASTLRAILNEDIKSKGYAFQIEMTVRAHKMGFNIAEIPIHFENRKMGVSKMDLNIAIEAIQICWWLLGNMQEYRMQKP